MDTSLTIVLSSVQLGWMILVYSTASKNHSNISSTELQNMDAMAGAVTWENHISLRLELKFCTKMISSWQFFCAVKKS